MNDGDDMKYEPRNQGSRQALAGALVDMLEDAGFAREIIPGTKEAVYSRPLNEKVRVACYTSIVSGECRDVGYDAIRVVALYSAKDGKSRGICKAEKRVNRVGQVEAIVERTLERMREVYKTAQTPDRCECCGAPKFVSKKGNPVCADLCWLTDEQRNRSYRPRRRSYKRNRRYARVGG